MAVGCGYQLERRSRARTMHVRHSEKAEGVSTSGAEYMAVRTTDKSRVRMPYSLHSESTTIVYKPDARPVCVQQKLLCVRPTKSLPPCKQADLPPHPTQLITARK
jgi:hypothetical protein